MHNEHLTLICARIGVRRALRAACSCSMAVEERKCMRRGKIVCGEGQKSKAWIDLVDLVCVCVCAALGAEKRRRDVDMAVCWSGLIICASSSPGHQPRTPGGGRTARWNMRPERVSLAVVRSISESKRVLSAGHFGYCRCRVSTRNKTGQEGVAAESRVVVCSRP